MERRGLVCLLGLFFLMTSGTRGDAQLSVAYHLHAQTSGSYYLLETNYPTLSATTLNWTLPDCSGCDSYPATFISQYPHPFAIASGSTMTFTVWLALTSSRNGTYYPWAQAGYSDTNGFHVYCAATGATPVTTTLTSYALSCTTQSLVEPNEAIYLYVGLYQSAGPGHHSVSGELGLEGVTNGVNDSYVVVPPAPAPVITSISPDSATIGSTVAVYGRYFSYYIDVNNSLLGTASTTINGTVAGGGYMNDGIEKINARSGTTSGPVVVTVNGVSSNSVNLTIAPGVTALSPASGSIWGCPLG